MIFSKKSFEGYVEIDNRDSPGFTLDQAQAGARTSLLPFLGAGQRFQAATNTCSHCDRVVVQNPLRTRERGHCMQCDRFICDDPCTIAYRLTTQCHCRARRIDLLLIGNRASKGDT